MHFNYDNDNLNIHLASLDTISTQHLRDPVLKLPKEDEVYQKIGQKRNNIEQRNGNLNCFIHRKLQNIQIIKTKSHRLANI